MLPVWRTRRTSLIAAEALTANRAAASRAEALSSTARTRRLRRSCDKGAVITSLTASPAASNQNPRVRASLKCPSACAVERWRPFLSVVRSFKAATISQQRSSSVTGTLRGWPRSARRPRSAPPTAALQTDRKSDGARPELLAERPIEGGARHTVERSRARQQHHAFGMAGRHRVEPPAQTDERLGRDTAGGARLHQAASRCRGGGRSAAVPSSTAVPGALGEPSPLT